MDIKQEFLHYLKHTPTEDQSKLIDLLLLFLWSNETDKCFVLKGYAGTGKTSLLSCVVKILPLLNRTSVLLAPTGRAAKVLANYTNRFAATIHKKIYYRQGEITTSNFVLSPNKHKNTIFITDEASMIGLGSGLNNNSLLDDLIRFVKNGENCSLMLVGDIAQLPPVGTTYSPALDVEYLHNNWSLNLSHFELKQVVRQALDSGILYNATQLRRQIQGDKSILFDLKGFTDIEKSNGAELEDNLNDAYNKYGFEETIIITRSNKRANLYNQQIRVRIKDLEGELATGDLLMCVKNNYYWTLQDKEIGFIANGDTLEVLRIRNFENLYGLHFADVTVRLTDYKHAPELEIKILLDALMVETPSLSQAVNKKLYQDVWDDYDDIKNRTARKIKVKEDAYFNALQVKFANAVTCHKSQGGQWKCVFIEQGYLTDEMVNEDYKRWLYTALTRATEKVYLVNFNASFFKDMD